MAEQPENVRIWIATTLELIKQASEYAASGEEDQATRAMIRQLRVLNGAFMAALQSIPG